MKDKIPTENDVTTISELKAFLKENNHPVVERWVEMEEEEAAVTPAAGEDYVQLPGEFTAAISGAGGGLEIIFKNAKIYAEKMIIRRTGKGEKKK
jgi:acetyl-CoA decarbonylase/synthase complex subunit beta